MATSPAPSPRRARRFVRVLTLPVLATGLVSACLADPGEDTAADSIETALTLPDLLDYAKNNGLE